MIILHLPPTFFLSPSSRHCCLYLLSRFHFAPSVSTILNMPPCPYCQQEPCWLQEGLYDALVEMEEHLRAGDFDNTLTNKKIRFELYRIASHWIHGPLPKGKRIQLPQCVEADIRDLAHEPGGNYVGFKEGDRD
jgi:glutaredoxin